LGHQLDCLEKKTGRTAQTKRGGLVGNNKRRKGADKGNVTKEILP